MIINDAYFLKESIYKFNMMQTDFKILIFSHFLVHRNNIGI